MRKSMLIEGFKNTKQVGSIASSSNSLYKKMVKGLDFSKTLRIVELGAGNGVFTKKLLAQMTPDSELVCYENYEPFVPVLEAIGDDRLEVRGESVETMTGLKAGYYDAVISSLPLANFNRDFKQALFNDIEERLKSGGVYRQYQYSLFDRKNIIRRFGSIRMDFTPINVPPAFVYKVTKKG